MASLADLRGLFLFGSSNFGVSNCNGALVSPCKSLHVRPTAATSLLCSRELMEC